MHTPINRKNATPDIIALSTCFIVFLGWLNLLIDKFAYFGYYDWDLALYANAMWNLAHGSFHSSLFGTNFLTNHAEYLSFVLAPFYLMFSSAFTLILFKLFSFIVGSFALYLIAKETLGGPVAILLMLMYQFHPANLFMLLYEFHFENLAIAFIFLMFYFFLHERIVPFLVTAFFATLIKENIPLVVLMFGIYAFFTKRSRKTAWVMGPFILGGGVFVLAMFVVTPHLRMLEGISTANQYIGLYWSHPDKTLPLSKVLCQNLLSVWGNFNAPLNISFMKQLFGAFGILPFLSPHVLFLGLPIFLQNFLSCVPAMHTFYYHYAATMIPFIFLATVITLGELKKRFRVVSYRLILFSLIFIYPFHFFVHLPALKSRMAGWQDRLDSARWQMVDTVPKDASVIATFDFLDKLANRTSLYSLHTLWINASPFRHRKSFDLPSDTRFALIDWECPWLWGDILDHDAERSRDMLRRLSDFYFQGNWRVRNAVEEIVLLEKNEKDLLPLLVDVFRNPTSELVSKPLSAINSQFLLLDFAIDEQSRLSNVTVPLTFLWRAEQNITDLYGMVIALVREGETVFRWYHHPGYGVYATPLWQEGEYIKEHYWIRLPSLSPGEYNFSISLFNLTKQRREELAYQNQSGRAVSVMTFTVEPVRRLSEEEN